MGLFVPRVAVCPEGAGAIASVAPTVAVPVREGEPRCEHAIVVLGCPTEADGTPTPRLRHRLECALAQFRADPTARVVVTGGAVIGPAEGPAMCDWLVAHGVPRTQIMVEDRARYTLDNVRKVAPMLRRLGASRVTVVTSRFHLQRGQTLMAAELARRGWSEVAVRGVAAPDGLSDAERDAMRAQETKKLRRDLDTLLSARDQLGYSFRPERFSRRGVKGGACEWAA